MRLDNEFWMKLAAGVAKQSKDPSTKVGCVIVKPNGYMVSAGFNHFGRGLTDKPELYEDRKYKYPRMVHAEMDAILHAAEKVDDCTLYSTLFPCAPCALHIIEAGIKTVFSVLPDDMERWRESFELSIVLFEDAGVKAYILPNGIPDV